MATAARAATAAAATTTAAVSHELKRWCRCDAAEGLDGRRH
jgi:hypothetical protein